MRDLAISPNPCKYTQLTSPGPVFPPHWMGGTVQTLGAYLTASPTISYVAFFWNFSQEYWHIGHSNRGFIRSIRIRIKIVRLPSLLTSWLFNSYWTGDVLRHKVTFRQIAVRISVGDARTLPCCSNPSHASWESVCIFLIIPSKLKLHYYFIYKIYFQDYSTLGSIRGIIHVHTG